MRRVLLLITDLEIGGTPTVVRELALRLRGPDCQVDVACLRGFGPVATQLTKAGVNVKGFAASGIIDLPAVVRELRDHIVERRIDTVISFLVHPNVIAALASRKLPGVRWIQSIQTTQPTPRWHWLAQRIAQLAAEKVVVPSPSVAAVAQDWADVPEPKIVVIPNAIDVDPLSGTGYQPVNHGLVAHATQRVGFIGRLDPVKRIPDLLAAVATLPKEVTLDLWGEGSHRPVVEATIARLGLAERVKLHGAIASPHEALQQIDILVLPSEAEGFGLVLIEAMAAGVPVVATNVAGIRDVVREGQTGLLVPPRSPDLLAGAISRIISDHLLTARLVDAGRREVEARYTWDRVLPMYRQLLGIA